MPCPFWLAGVGRFIDWRIVWPLLFCCYCYLPRLFYSEITNACPLFEIDQVISYRGGGTYMVNAFLPILSPVGMIVADCSGWMGGVVNVLTGAWYCR